MRKHFFLFAMTRNLEIVRSDDGNFLRLQPSLNQVFHLNLEKKERKIEFSDIWRKWRFRSKPTYHFTRSFDHSFTQSLSHSILSHCNPQYPRPQTDDDLIHTMTICASPSLALDTESSPCVSHMSVPAVSMRVTGVVVVSTSTISGRRSTSRWDATEGWARKRPWMLGENGIKDI